MSGSAQGRSVAAVAVRIGDAERERVRELLSRHAADGRISLDEFSDRLGEVYAARTAAELEGALRELPPLPAGTLPPPPGQRSAQRARVRAAVVGYLAFVVLMLTIWAATGAGFFWPLWPVVGMGFGVARNLRAQDGQDDADAGRRGPGFGPGTTPWGVGGICGRSSAQV